MSQSRLRLIERRSEHPAVQTSQLTIAGRPFLLLEYQSDKLSLFGEAAPLSGYGQDSLSQARDELLRLRAEELDAGAELLAAEVERGASLMRADLWRRLPWENTLSSPAARFCADMLVARLCAAKRNVSLFDLFPARSQRAFLPTSEVLDPLREGELERLEGFFLQGVRCFKLKCGRDAEQELDFIARLRERHPVTACESDKVLLRLDFNRALAPVGAHAFFRSLDPRGVQWIEDPTPRAEDWFALSDYGIPLAADEPLSWEPRENWSLFEVAQVLVVKPMALGGFGRCLDLADHAGRSEQSICVSHLFDGPCSFEATAALAFSIHSAPGAVGLSEHAGLKGARLGSSPALEYSWLKPDRLIVPKSS